MSNQKQYWAGVEPIRAFVKDVTKTATGVVITAEQTGPGNTVPVYGLPTAGEAIDAIVFTDMPLNGDGLYDLAPATPGTQIPLRVAAAVAVGDDLSVDATGRFIKATDGVVVAKAITSAAAEDEIIQAMVK